MKLGATPPQLIAGDGKGPVDECISLLPQNRLSPHSTVLHGTTRDVPCGQATSVFVGEAVTAQLSTTFACVPPLPFFFPSLFVALGSHPSNEAVTMILF